MGHIVPRKRGGKVVHREAQTFDRRQAANAWMARRETELSKPGAIERARQAGNDPKLRDVIDRYTDESEREIGRTKAQVLRTIKGYDIAELRCSQITSADVVSFVQAIAAGPATRQNYLSHLGAIFTIARPAWGYPLDPQTIEDAFAVTKRLGVTAKGKSRDQRPTLNELDHLDGSFRRSENKAPEVNPDAEDYRLRDFLDAASGGNRTHSLARFRSGSQRTAGAHPSPRHEAPRRKTRQRYVVRVDARSGGHHRVNAEN